MIRSRHQKGNIDFTYLCSTKVGSITNGSESITYDYDGKLVTSETLSGTLNQALGYTYNDDFNLISMSYAGATESYTYDNDGLLTGAGSFADFSQCRKRLAGIGCWRCVKPDPGLLMGMEKSTHRIIL